MISRLKHRLLELKEAAADKVYSLKKAHRRRQRSNARVIKGRTDCVIVVPSPDPKVFREALFIINENYLLYGGISREELLQQAKEAAENYCREYIPERRNSQKLLWLLPCSLALLGLGLKLFVC